MSTEWRFVEDVLPPPDEDVMVTDGDAVGIAKRTVNGDWDVVYRLLFGDIVAWFRIPRVPEPYEYEEWKLKRYGHL